MRGQDTLAQMRALVDALERNTHVFTDEHVRADAERHIDGLREAIDSEEAK